MIEYPEINISTLTNHGTWMDSAASQRKQHSEVFILQMKSKLHPNLAEASWRCWSWQRRIL